ncbi:MAG: hypothetical protein AAF530_17250 [Pseudomonadota bacterium]
MRHYVAVFLALVLALSPLAPVHGAPHGDRGHEEIGHEKTSSEIATKAEVHHPSMTETAGVDHRLCPQSKGERSSYPPCCDVIGASCFFCFLSLNRDFEYLECHGVAERDSLPIVRLKSLSPESTAPPPRS